MRFIPFALVSVAALLAMYPVGLRAQQQLVFVGSGRKNIESFRFDPAAGTLTKIGLAAEIAHPSFIYISPNHKYLYSITEGGNADSSSISAFAIDATAGKLTFLNKQPAKGSGPCYVEVDSAGKNALIANYGSGSFAAFPLAANGEVQPMSAFVQDSGSSVDKSRQEGPHAHCLVAGPGDKFVYGCDLGLDKVMIFKFDTATGSMVAADPPFAKVKPGAGPRHLAFHPNGRFAYLVNEMGCTINPLSYDPATGALTELQTISTLPPGYSGNSTCAEIAVHVSGKFVYASNRGHDSIAIFKCDPDTGHLTFVECVPTGGKIPRQFEIDPTGKFLLAANQESNTVVVFKIDQTTGHLEPTGSKVETENPMCVRFLPTTN